MPPSEKAPNDPAAAREAKLAEALRANLRRRKAGPGRKPAPEESAKKAGDDR